MCAHASSMSLSGGITRRKLWRRVHATVLARERGGGRSSHLLEGHAALDPLSAEYCDARSHGAKVLVEERVARAVWAVRERTRSSGEREGERERGEEGGEDAFVSWGIHD